MIFFLEIGHLLMSSCLKHVFSTLFSRTVLSTPEWSLLLRVFSQVLWMSCKVWIHAGRSSWRHVLWAASVAAQAVLAAPVEEPKWVTAWPTIQAFFLSLYISWSKMAAALPTLLSPLLSPSGILLVVNSLQLLKELYGLLGGYLIQWKLPRFVTSLLSVVRLDLPASCSSAGVSLICNQHLLYLGKVLSLSLSVSASLQVCVNMCKSMYELFHLHVSGLNKQRMFES